ncbi:VOC family protein [Halocatena pleomorpha]|uniref:VOC family protein n=1 Tax=Halocatena pleomorpha TaxID=1785090 RepID=A0A3P3R886_9EURY|nr:VOC family protein [Halocatena pleomorpha]RRJ29139.1 VOC family protein [Halocatena pleomorpha]
MSNQATLPRSTHIGRVFLRVGDLDQTVEYYETVIGLTTHQHDDGRAVLGTGTDPLVVVVAAPDVPPRSRTETGLFHVAFRVPSRTALAAALGRIRDHDRWQLDGASDHLVSEALYATDPAGNGVEVYCDRPRDAWPTPADGSVGMETRPLDIESLPEHSQEPTVPSGTTVGHVHLENSSLAAARAFYVDDLGFRVRDQFGESALFVAAGDYHHHIGLNTWNERTEPHTGRGLDRFEIVVPDQHTLDTVQSRLDASGRRFTTTEDGVEVSDPDGIDLRVITE